MKANIQILSFFNILLLASLGSKIQDCRNKFLGSILDPAGPILKYEAFANMVTLVCGPWSGSKQLISAILDLGSRGSTSRYERKT